PHRGLSSRSTPATKNESPADFIPVPLPRSGTPVSQQVVIRVPVHVSPQIFAVGALHDPDLGALAAGHRVESIRLGIDRVDHLLAGPSPVRTAEMSDALVRVLPRLFVNACDLRVCHELPPPPRGHSGHFNHYTP